jgi:hypothetical protein
MIGHRTLTTFTAALVLATTGLFAAGADATSPETGPDQVVWAKTTGTNASDLLSGVQLGSFHGDALRSANVARADSTDCTDCRTVAVAIQGVVVKGSPHTATPTNAALAINQNCLRCTTYAYAYQYIVTTETRARLSRRARRQVAALREEVATVARSDLSPEALDARLTALSADFRAAIDTDLRRQDEDVEDREVERDDDLD